MRVSADRIRLRDRIAHAYRMANDSRRKEMGGWQGQMGQSMVVLVLTIRSRMILLLTKMALLQAVIPQATSLVISIC